MFMKILCDYIAVKVFFGVGCNDQDELNFL